MLANMRIYVYAGYPPKKRRILHGIKLLNARNKILELKKFSLFFLASLTLNFTPFGLIMYDIFVMCLCSSCSNYIITVLPCILFIACKQTSWGCSFFSLKNIHIICILHEAKIDLKFEPEGTKTSLIQILHVIILHGSSCSYALLCWIVGIVEVDCCKFV